VTVAVIALVAALMFMLAELRVSQAHEHVLRTRGAIAPVDTAYSLMQWSYPGVFVVMAVEGALFGAAPWWARAAGVVVFVAAKALKVWAMRSLGERWTYRVFVLPDVPLVTTGPYRVMRHPNYAAVTGELVGMALVVGARVTGPLSLVWFGYLLRLRIDAEERALRMR
jgi:methyltransferase